MKLVQLVAVALTALLVASVQASHAQQGNAPGQNAGTIVPDDMYRTLRNGALTRELSGGDQLARHVLVLDMGISDGQVASLVLYGDGTASIYMSNGGAIIGTSNAHPEVGEAARKVIGALSGAIPELMQTKLFSATSSYPLPVADQAKFYVRTPSGVLAASASIDDLEGGKHKLSSLWSDLQAILSDIFKKNRH